MTSLIDRLRTRDFSYFDGIEWRRSDELCGLAADEIKALRDELFDLRCRAGCGPDQTGPDIWRQLTTWQAAHGEAIEESAIKSDHIAHLRGAYLAHIQMENACKRTGVPCRESGKCGCFLECSDLIAAAPSREAREDAMETALSTGERDNG
jgi:hypothetical protein